MIFRDFDPEIEKIAADWAGRAMIEPDEFADEDESLIQAVKRRRHNYSGRLNHFFFQNRFMVFAKKRPTPVVGSKVISDIAFQAGLPVCPEILTECSPADSDIKQLICISMRPFQDRTSHTGLDRAPEIAAVATVLDTWCVNTLERKYDDNCAPDELSTPAASCQGKIGLFDFDGAFGINRPEEYKSKIWVPEDVSLNSVDKIYGFETVRRLLEIPSEQIVDVVVRIPEEYGRFMRHELAEILKRQRMLPDLFEPHFKTAVLNDKREPEAVYNRSLALAGKLKP